MDPGHSLPSLGSDRFHDGNIGSIFLRVFRNMTRYIHTTLLLALPAERVRQVLRLQVGSSEKKVQVVFVISLDVLVIPSNKQQIDINTVTLV